MSKEMKLADVSDDFLRAWADAGVITHAEYVAEIERRKKERQQEKSGA